VVEPGVFNRQRGDPGKADQPGLIRGGEFAVLLVGRLDHADDASAQVEQGRRQPAMKGRTMARVPRVRSPRRVRDQFLMGEAHRRADRDNRAKAIEP
jgi:hypothetical protein